jgi:hypothetical protein
MAPRVKSVRPPESEVEEVAAEVSIPVVEIEEDVVVPIAVPPVAKRKSGRKAWAISLNRDSFNLTQQLTRPSPGDLDPAPYPLYDQYHPRAVTEVAWC